DYYCCSYTPSGNWVF
nr:immunoglobulin light chain junction region [Macaca mulatta]MOW28839.1 immunoglobulin light chain junction region [Macaca mulatta]